MLTDQAIFNHPLEEIAECSYLVLVQRYWFRIDQRQH